MIARMGVGYEHLRVALGLRAFSLERPAREASVKQLTARSDRVAVSDGAFEAIEQAVREVLG